MSSEQFLLFEEALPLSQKGVANGVASLDGDGRVPLAQMPTSVAGGLSFKSDWNPNTNTPALSGTGDANTRMGDFYVVSADYTGQPTAIIGHADWRAGDWAIVKAVAGGPGYAITWAKIEGGTAEVNFGITTVTGQNAVANGGTGVATLAANGVLFGNGAAAVGVTAAGTAGQPLLSGGGAAPAFGQVGTNGIADVAVTAAKLAVGAVDLATTVVTGTLDVPRGGTGRAALPAGDLVVGNGTGAVALVPDIAVNNVLLSGGVGAPPSYGKVGLTTHVSGTLAEGSGGTNQTTYAVGEILHATGANTLGKLAPGTVALPLVSGGAGAVSSYAALTAAGLAADAVTTAKIADASVTTAKIADANVTTLKIADAGVTPAKLSVRTGITSILSPSYPGGVTSVLGNGTFSLTSDPNASGSGANKLKNFYNRTAGAGGTTRTGTIMARWQVPHDYVASSLTSFKVAVRSLTTSSADGSVDVSLWDTAGTLVSLTGATTLVSSSADLVEDKTVTITGSPTFTPGSELTVRVVISIATASHTIRVGALTFTYSTQ